MSSDEPVQKLDRDQYREFVKQGTLGRLATAVGGEADHARARELERQSEIDEAERTPLQPWIPTLKYRYVHIDIDRVTGRRFQRTPEPVSQASVSCTRLANGCL